MIGLATDPARTDALQLSDASPDGGLLSPATFPQPGDRYRLRLKLWGHFDVNTVNMLTSLIRNASNVAHYFHVLEFEAVSDDHDAGFIPMSSQALENWSLYVTAEYVGPEQKPPSWGPTGAMSASQFDPITLTVCVGTILALLAVVIVVVGWTVEKVDHAGDKLTLPFLAIFILGAAYMLTRAS